MDFNQQKYWVEAIIKHPALIRWYPHWRSSLKNKRSPLNDELPWMTYRAIDWLNNHLKKGMNVFEWGSGGSTAFFARRAKHVYTVEHDLLWYQEVIGTLEKKAYDNVSITLVESVQCENIKNWYTTSDPKYKNHSFEQYIRVIDTYPDGTFDIVIVDGRARPGCMKHAIPKIKVGGYLLLDNSERMEYQMGWDLVQQWKNIKIWGPGPYNNYPWETRIWQKNRL
jgi:hypothetical protein